MTRTEALYKLLKLGPLEKLHAFHISGWTLEEFTEVLQEAMSAGLVDSVPFRNQNCTHLAAREGAHA